MSLKEWKNNEINTKLMKKWGLLKEGVPEVSKDKLDSDDVLDGPGDMSVKDGKLVKAVEEDLDEAHCGREEDEIEEAVEETSAPKMISIHEAKQITRRILNRIREESK